MCLFVHVRVCVGVFKKGEIKKIMTPDLTIVLLCLGVCYGFQRKSYGTWAPKLYRGKKDHLQKQNMEPGIQNYIEERKIICKSKLC